MATSSENLFRIVFGGLWILYFGVRLYFQRKVKGAGNVVRINEKQERFFFWLFALAFLLLALYFITSWIDFAHVAFPVWLRWAGAGVTLIGIGLFGWAHQVLGLNWTAVLALAEKHVLVTNGPYRYARHPMYTAFFTIGFGFLFLSANWLVGALYLGTLLMMYLARISPEEKMMIDRFGDDYRQYMQRTGRLLPRIIKM